MARRRAIADPNQALELFLDALCNAFGGIIFISLLVCVMLQLSGTLAGPVATDEVELVRLEHELRGLEDEAAALRQAIADQQARLAALEATESSAVQQHYLTLVQEEGALRESNAQLKATLAQLETNLQTSSAEAARLATQIDNDRNRQLQLQERLQRLRARARVTLSVPTEATTTKRQVAATIYQGRLAFVMVYDGRGKVVGNNTRDLEFTLAPDGTPEITPIAGKGLEFHSAEALESQLARFLKQFAAKPGHGLREEDCSYFMVAIWPDSFEQFELLRNLLIERGFEYGLMFMEEGEAVRTGGRKVKL